MYTLILGSLAIVVVSIKAPASDSFKNCAAWINEQTDTRIVGPSSSSRPNVKFTDSGALEFINRDAFQEKKLPENGSQEYIFAPHRELRDTINSKPNEPNSRDFHDRIDITRDGTGRIIKIKFDILTGGRGDTINGTRYQYYRKATELHFDYDENGCFPKKGESWRHAEGNVDRRELLFDFDLCKQFRELYALVPHEQKTTPPHAAVQSSWMSPLLPPPSDVRERIVENLFALVPNIRDEAKAKYRAFAKKSPPPDANELRFFNQEWEHVYSWAANQCHGNRYRPEDVTSFSLYSFLNARGVAAPGSRATTTSTMSQAAATPQTQKPNKTLRPQKKPPRAAESTR